MNLTALTNDLATGAGIALFLGFITYRFISFLSTLLRLSTRQILVTGLAWGVLTLGSLLPAAIYVTSLSQWPVVFLVLSAIATAWWIFVIDSKIGLGLSDYLLEPEISEDQPYFADNPSSKRRRLAIALVQLTACGALLFTVAGVAWLGSKILSAGPITWLAITPGVLGVLGAVLFLPRMQFLQSHMTRKEAAKIFRKDAEVPLVIVVAWLGVYLTRVLHVPLWTVGVVPMIWIYFIAAKLIRSNPEPR